MRTEVKNQHRRFKFHDGKLTVWPFHVLGLFFQAEQRNGGSSIDTQGTIGSNSTSCNLYFELHCGFHLSLHYNWQWLKQSAPLSTTHWWHRFFDRRWNPQRCSTSRHHPGWGQNRASENTFQSCLESWHCSQKKWLWDQWLWYKHYSGPFYY